MMAEYIERAVVLSIHEPSKSNRYYQTDNLDDAYGQGWDDALCCIERLPAADVAPVVHGRWIPDGDFVICSQCEAEMNQKNSLGADNSKNYCPNCGAKMDGVK